MIKFLLVFCIFFNSIAFACPESVQPLKKGEVANCNGLLYSPEADDQAAKDHLDAKYYKEINLRLEKRKELTDKEIEILDKRLNLYVDQSQTLADQLAKKESTTKWERVLWFGLGVLATGIAVSGAKRL